MPRENLLTNAETEAGGKHDQEGERRAEHIEDAYGASAQHGDVVYEESVDTLEVCQPPDSHPSHRVRYTYNTIRGVLTHLKSASHPTPTGHTVFVIPTTQRRPNQHNIPILLTDVDSASKKHCSSDSYVQEK